MAESKEEIVNAALVYVGQTEFVDDLATEDSTAANVANEVYLVTLGQVLRDFDWPFATVRTKPAQLTATTLALGAVPDGWTYAYAYPVDSDGHPAAKLRKVYPGVRTPRTDQETPHVVERDTLLKARIILTDDSAPELVWTQFLTDPSQYPDDFSDALSWKLAIKFAAGLRKDATTVKLAFDGYERARGVAAANARSESPGDRQAPAPDWIANR